VERCASFVAWKPRAVSYFGSREWQASCVYMPTKARERGCRVLGSSAPSGHNRLVRRRIAKSEAGQAMYQRFDLIDSRPEEIEWC